MSDNNRADIIKRIRKLLEHTSDRGCTEAEAIQAALAAQRLMADNDVSEWEVHGLEEEPIEQSFVKRGKKWGELLANIVASAFRCKAYVKHFYGSKVHVCFYGYASDASAASLVYEKLYRVGNRLANKEANGYSGHTHTVVYDSFTWGFLDGVESELEKQSEALMIVVPPKVNQSYEAFCETNVFSESRHKTFHVNESIEDKGYIAGRDAVRSGRLGQGEQLSLTA